MMTLISLGIVVAFAASLAATFGFFRIDLWWEVATLITIVLFRHWLEIETQPQECSDEREFTKASAQIPVALARREFNKLGVPERKQEQSPLAE